jgi:hypothetical protein
MKEYSEKYRFKSIYGSGYITDAQYLTEQLCAHVAKYTQEDLIDHFWKLPKWETFFKQQIPAANALLKKYSVECILEALRDKKMSTLYSFRAPFFIKLVEKLQIKKDLIDARPKHTTSVNVGVENTKPRKPFGKPTIRHKLEKNG